MSTHAVCLWSPGGWAVLLCLLIALCQVLLGTHHCRLWLVPGRCGCSSIPGPSYSCNLSLCCRDLLTPLGGLSGLGSWPTLPAPLRWPPLYPRVMVNPRTTNLALWPPPSCTRLYHLSSVKRPSLGSRTPECSCGVFWIPSSVVSPESCWSHTKHHNSNPLKLPALSARI